MESKKEIKVSLGIVICIFIIVLLIIALGIVYYLGFVKNNGRKLEADNIELNKQITSLNLENENLSKKISELEKEEKNEDGNKCSEEYNEYLENKKYLDNGQITNIDDKTRLFTSENPKISFEFPSSWMISSTNNDDYWRINVKSPQKGVYIIIGKEKILSDKVELKDIFSLEFGSTVLDEGNIRISNYNGYYKRYSFGDSTENLQSKKIIIDLGNNQYYSFEIYAVSDYYYNYYSQKELEEIYEEYEPIFDNIVSSMKF